MSSSSRFMRETHDLCDEHGDVATASLLENWIDEAERRVWFLYETSRPRRFRRGRLARPLRDYSAMREATRTSLELPSGRTTPRRHHSSSSLLRGGSASLSCKASVVVIATPCFSVT